MEEGRNHFKILTDTPTRKIHLLRPGHKLENNITMDLKEIGIRIRIIGEPL